MTDAYPALWGGFECSVVRVGADYRNQLVETGHDIREADMALAKSLGISALRYPLLWETVSPASVDALIGAGTDDVCERLSAQWA